MRLALFAPEDEKITFTNKINLSVDDFIIVDQFSNNNNFAVAQTHTNYDALWVATDGAKGMEIVIYLKETNPHIPVIWESEDEMFSLVAYNLKVSSFLLKNAGYQELTKAIDRIKTRCNHEFSVVL